MDFAKVEKLTTDAKFEISDVKAVIAALEFVLRSAAKYDCDDGTLCNELQQLGLPKEHSESVVRPYREKKEALRDKFADESLKLTRVEKIDWRVDYVISSSQLHEANTVNAQVELKVSDSAKSSATRTIAFEASQEKLRVLLHELQAARSLMDSVE